MYRKRKEPDDGLTRTNYPYRFGSPYKELLDCIVLFEGKTKISLHALLDKCGYTFREQAGCVLFDSTSFFILSGTKFGTWSCVKAKWTDKG
ncbi:hypothetical protein THRCLA_22007 [Thraustotheca clavata]|uniref:Crinkler (CRN) family protein n=1 Tax=Thraustotheca clavata TaxID=74557 RepID=A0A1V9ZEB5_9STRA|nr:hypothetical protein THRCLA_22007 [Thraustotheca clavata]